MVKTVASKLPRVMVTAGPGALKDKAVLETPAGTADVQVVALPWWRQVLIRSVRTFLQTFVGNLGNIATGVGGTVAVTAGLGGPEILSALASAALMTVLPFVAALAQNTYEVLGEMDNPKLRA